MRKLLLLLLLASTVSFSQDTIPVYFDFGSSRLKPAYEAVLGRLGADYDLSLVDSVQFIGYADSVGDRNANTHLSLRRAKNTYKFCKKLLERTVVISMLARGEGTRKTDSLNRRVDVILYYPKSGDGPDDKQPEEILTHVDPRCFFIDFDALENCHVRYIRKKNKELVYIEAMDLDLFRDTKHYYVNKEVKGKTTIQRLKWKTEVTGRFWWKKKRLVAGIPRKGFDQFRFFTLHDAPCDGCSEKILDGDTVVFTYASYYPDLFLLDNAQVKTPFLRRKQVRIRVPKEYVDPADSYYYSRRAYTTYSSNSFQWEEKRGRRRQNYYYAEFPVVDGEIPYIQKKRLVSRCVVTTRRDLTGNTGWMNCGTRWGSRLDIGFRLNLEAGAFYHNDTLTGFLVAGISHATQRSSTSLQAGINTHVGFYGSLNYKYHFLSFPLRALNPVANWQNGTAVTAFNLYLRAYAGADLKTSYTSKYSSFVEGNVHLGLSFFNTRYAAFLPQLYVQGGIARDFSNRINVNGYAFVQVGVRINVGSF
jgi:hypothetical protein